MGVNLRLQWKKLWTSFLVRKHAHTNINKKNLLQESHPYFFNKRLTKHFDRNSNMMIEKLVSTHTDLNGLSDVFHIITKHYNQNTNFLNLNSVSPSIAVQMNQSIQKQHRIDILDCTYLVVGFKEVDQIKNLRSIENLFFGMCRKKILYELCCGIVGPEASHQIPRPKILVMDVTYLTKEKHIFGSHEFITNNIHEWSFVSDSENVEWILDEFEHQ